MALAPRGRAGAVGRPRQTPGGPLRPREGKPESGMGAVQADEVVPGKPAVEVLPERRRHENAPVAGGGEGSA